ncbi:dioxygenase [Halarcobacter ebronensis]|uniref:Dioxygenase n=1 Tax=Halarcobacter ebronensis TaxID=1462615 RepID=A0A4Q0YD82_9BACT|nr:class III extradiol ring-cleavage dioxygenase [Halarcobacter ebronensis]RXJ68033.1 dioxygenase [Halarcobacter ebronensis]
MEKMMLPALFISHGSPQLMTMNNSTTNFLKKVSSTYKRPKYILVISAHWVTNNIKILYTKSPSLIYDFYNFPKELYELTYNANSSIEKSDEIISLLEKGGFSVEKDTKRGGFDHGVWSPLRFLYPNAEIPVIQLSLPYNLNQYELYKVGEILKELREDTLLIASGSITHNLRDLSWGDENSQVKSYAKKFHDWLIKKLENAEYKLLLDEFATAPYLKLNHPTLDHILPLFIVLGSSSNKKGESLHNEYMYGNLSMDTIIFKE